MTTTDSRTRRSRTKPPRRGRIHPSMLIFLFVGLYAFWLFNQRDELEIHREAFLMMGTVVEVTVSVPHDTDAEALLAGAHAEMERVAALFNPRNAESFVARLNRQPTGVPLAVGPDEGEVLDVLEQALRISELSEGAFDITFASVDDLWRFDRENPSLPTPDQIARIPEKIDYRRVVVDREALTVTLLGEGTRIGLGGIAKGTVVDKGAAWLGEHGVDAALINAGGDIRGFGRKPDGSPWRVGLRHPREKGKLVPGVRLPVADFSLVTSGDYERSFVIDGTRYHHILNPKTGMPATGLISVTLFAPTTELADALATAVFVLGPDEGLALAEKTVDVEAILITDHERILATTGLPPSITSIELAVEPEEE
jgi:FAD:protein FMN transferase